MSEQVYASRSRRGLRVLLAVVVVALVAGGAYVAFNGRDQNAAETEGDGKPQTINIVGFAVPEAANKAIAAQFAKTKAGSNVTFRTSYGASGDQSRAVEAGLKADYVHFSVGTDVTRLVDAGLVAADWDKGANKGVVSTSVVVFGVREGNPKNITKWDDLLKPGVKVVTPNPASSGAARWNALAAWGNVTENGGSEKEATEFIDKLFSKEHIAALPNSGRDATKSFLDGNGDVLLAYENEAILAAQNGEGFEYVIPETSIKIENPGAVLKKATPAATDWLEFVLSDEGQKQFALKGFRPIRDDVDFGGHVAGATYEDNPFPAVQHLLTLDDFGGWAGVKDKLFGDGKEGKPKGIVTLAIESSGQAVE